MSKSRTHLGAARRHGRKAATELRRMTADTALHWVLSHKARVAAFRRSVKGTSAAAPVERLLARIRAEATPLARPTPRRRKTVRARRHPVERSWLNDIASFPIA
jgi:hypothetical protein